MTVVIYPFETDTPPSPLVVETDGKLIKLFFFEQIKLWEVEASSFFNEHLVDLYALLPTMKGANRAMIRDALKEMVEYYNDRLTLFGGQLKWLQVLMNRAEILPVEDKLLIQEEISMWNDLIYEDPVFQKEFAAREAKGEVKGAKEVLLTLIGTRFPALADLAQQKLAKIQSVDALTALSVRVALASDEATARRNLEKLKP